MHTDNTPVRIKQTPLFLFHQLSDEAKEVARQWFREVAYEDEWWDHVYSDAVQAATLLGIEIGTRRGRAGPFDTPAIYFSGFWSQGDGASFEGYYQYAKGSLKAIREEFPTDVELNRIAKELHTIQARYFFKLQVRITQSGHYCHSHTMSCTTTHADDEWRDVGNADEYLKEAMRDFADWIYDRLRAEWDWLNADEQVDESIEANEYTFTETGKRED